jgi:hypothetical protein
MLNQSGLIGGDRGTTQRGRHNRLFSNAVIRCVCAHGPNLCGTKSEQALREFDETPQSESVSPAAVCVAYMQEECFGKSPESPYRTLMRHLAGGASTLVVLFPASPARAQGCLGQWALSGVSPWDALEGDWYRVGGDIARAMRRASKKDVPDAREQADPAESSEE